jgi:hypothetical protein
MDVVLLQEFTSIESRRSGGEGKGGHRAVGGDGAREKNSTLTDARTTDLLADGTAAQDHSVSGVVKAEAAWDGRERGGLWCGSRNSGRAPERLN